VESEFESGSSNGTWQAISLIEYLPEHPATYVQVFAIVPEKAYVIGNFVLRMRKRTSRVELKPDGTESVRLDQEFNFNEPEPIFVVRLGGWEAYGPEQSLLSILYPLGSRCEAFHIVEPLEQGTSFHWDWKSWNMNDVLELIPPNEKILTIERSAELFGLATTWILRRSFPQTVQASEASTAFGILGPKLRDLCNACMDANSGLGSLEPPSSDEQQVVDENKD
jgi:hypothetical protein